MAKEAKGSQSLPLWKVLLFVTVPLWVIAFPIGLAVYIVTLPWYLLRWILGMAPRTTPLSIRITGPAEDKAKDTILFVHGWPDSGELFWRQVAFFSESGYRCISVSLPNSSGKGGGWGHTFDEITDQLAKVVQDNVKSQKVTLFIHDWGCIHGYNLTKKHPSMVRRVVALDVGGELNLSLNVLVFILSYQVYNAVAFLMGGAAGMVLNGFLLKMMTYRERPLSEANASVNYPYLYFMLDRISGKKMGFIPRSGCPIFFGYASKNAVPFHAAEWLVKVQKADKKNKVQDYPCGHWIMSRYGDQLNKDVAEWLSSS